MNKITFNTEGCAGCRTCEIACSYHHKKLFSPSISSIEINDTTDKLGFTVSFYLMNMNGHLACDKCKGEDEPLCLKYCSILMRDELKALLKTEHLQKLPEERQV